MTHIDPEHGGVTDTQLEQYIQSRLGHLLPTAIPGQEKTGPQFLPGQGGPAPHNVDETQGSVQNPPSSDILDDDEEEDGTEDQTDEETSEEVTEPGTPEIPEIPTPEPPSAPNVTLPLDPERLQALVELDVLLRNDRALAEKVQRHLSRGGEDAGAGDGNQPTSPAPANQLPEIPQELLDDPAILALYQFAQTQNEHITNLQQQVAHTSDVVFNRERQEIDNIVRRVATNFAQEKGLSEAQIQQLGNVAGRMNLIDPLLRGIDPINGETVPVDREFAARRALEIAYWSVPQYRDKEYASQVQERAKDQRRKQRLAGIGGSSGSVPRATPVPTNPHERQAAAVRELAEMMGRSQE